MGRDCVGVGRPLIGLMKLLVIAIALAACVRADDGYRLWLRYDPVADPALCREYAQHFTEIVCPAAVAGGGRPASAMQAAVDELERGARGMLGAAVPIVSAPDRDGAIELAGSRDDRLRDGYSLRSVVGSHRAILIRSGDDVGVLYGAFALLRRMELGEPIRDLNTGSRPRYALRIIDHWDNLDGTIERGYAGRSLWQWSELPGRIDPRYVDYARAEASIGVNGTVLNNVNADARILTVPYLRKVAALADVFRSYGLRVYLSARFSAPVDIGGLPTADPLDPRVAAWWRAKADEIYQLIPDFGGFLVKANSEGQPGPQTYGRSHAQGANMMADALASHGGVVIWRAFVYSEKVRVDRIKQGYNEFKPLDGQFRGNVLLQIKNGPFDFQPREPFHPLFGAMPRTHLLLEVQITQEYMGQSKHLVYLAPLYRECLQSDTFARGPGSTVARQVDGMAGVANTGSDRDWCGHPFSPANWYAFGRLAWDPDLTSAQIADEWIRQSFGADPRVRQVAMDLMLMSRENEVSMTMPLGLISLFQENSHYGPEPWFDQGRWDWTAVFYHRAANDGLGFDRTASGSDAVAQYFPPVRDRFSALASCPDNLLLWFHHVPWDYRMHSGRTLWDELCHQYETGVNGVRYMEAEWQTLRGLVDPETFHHVEELLRVQDRDGRWWRDACLLYFQQFSHRPFPAWVGRPALTLAQYEAVPWYGVAPLPLGPSPPP